MTDLAEALARLEHTLADLAMPDRKARSLALSQTRCLMTIVKRAETEPKPIAYAMDRVMERIEI